MKKVAVVYWSGTGNTEKMANAVVEGAKVNDNTVDLIFATEFKADKVDEYDVIAFGCPSMGTDELEYGEFEPMWDNVSSKLASKPIVLFGSYDWGDGEWMKEWETKAKDLGADLLQDGLICNLEPDKDGLEECKKLGEVIGQ